MRASLATAIRTGDWPRSDAKLATFRVLDARAPDDAKRMRKAGGVLGARLGPLLDGQADPKPVKARRWRYVWIVCLAASTLGRLLTTSWGGDSATTSDSYSTPRSPEPHDDSDSATARRSAESLELGATAEGEPSLAAAGRELERSLGDGYCWTARRQVEALASGDASSALAESIARVIRDVHRACRAGN